VEESALATPSPDSKSCHIVKKNGEHKRAAGEKGKKVKGRKNSFLHLPRNEASNEIKTIETRTRREWIKASRPI
jgi:hypothetical protein